MKKEKKDHKNQMNFDLSKINGGNFRESALQLIRDDRLMEAIIICNRYGLSATPMRPCCTPVDKLLSLLM